MLTIAHLGLKGSFSHLAAYTQFTQRGIYISASNFKEMFLWVEQKAVDLAVIPIENSLIGSIDGNEDLFQKHSIYIVGESYLPISHDLLVPVGFKGELRDIHTVYSHPKVFEQCRKFLDMHPWIRLVDATDTAAAAEKVARAGLSGYAALAHSHSAQIYNLKIFKKSLEDEEGNCTRFIHIANGLQTSTANKCSLIVSLEHKPGKLLELLKKFEKFNLTKIESRPNQTKPFQYFFYLDFEFKEEQRKEMGELLNSLNVESYKLLGMYEGGKR